MSQSKTITLAHREGNFFFKNIGQRVKSAARSPGNVPVLSMASPRLWGRIRLMMHLNTSLRNGNLDEADEGDKAKR